LYLATILDDFTKEVVWYALSYHHTKEFILTAIQDAMKKTSWVTPQSYDTWVFVCKQNYGINE
jgi:hypothetical protein